MCEQQGWAFGTVSLYPTCCQRRSAAFFQDLYIIKDAGVNRPFHMKQWNVGSRLIKHDVTAGVHFSVILLQNYIATYGKNEETLTVCNSPFVQHIPVTELNSSRNLNL